MPDNPRKIEINYPEGLRGEKPVVALGEEIFFTTDTGEDVTVEFTVASPFEAAASALSNPPDPPRFRFSGKTPRKAVRPGNFKFDCFVFRNGKEEKLQGGGELEVRT